MASNDAKVLAGIDVGTLTCRLLIARVTTDHDLTWLHADRRVVRLGEDVTRTGKLSGPAMQRTIQTLREWRRSMDEYGVQAVVAVATSAVRDADNAKEFLRVAKVETGLDLDIVTGEEEARRTMLGIRSGLAADLGAVLGLDIGGGSTELILSRPSNPPRVRSIALGAVRLTEEVLRHNPPFAEEIARARQLVEEKAQGLQQWFGDIQGAPLVGTAGTVTTLAAMAQQLASYDPARIQNFQLSLATVVDLERELLGKTVEERQGWPGLEPGREQVIPAGTLILRGIMETLGFTTCLVSDRGLREGIVLDLAARLDR